MPEFVCRTVNENGELVETIVEAVSKYEILEQAASRNEYVVSVKRHRENFDINTWWSKFRKVKPQELEHFTNQLATMLQAGVPLIGCLQALKELTETQNMNKMIAEIIEKVNGGMALSQALSLYPRAFSALYVNMIKAGETAGVLDQILNRLTTFIRHDVKVTRNIKAAMRYPLIVLSVLILAFTGAAVFIIPRFSKLFMAQGIDLPLPTRMMIGFSNFVVNYWWMVLFGVGVLISGLVYYIRTPLGAYQFDLFKLKVPVFKEIISKSAVARFAHMLETLFAAGIQIIKALETTALTVGNHVFARVILEAKDQVAQGVSLAEALSESKYFPATTLQMISVGERTGAWDKMLHNVADQYDAEVDVKIQGLSASLEPMLTVMMGIFLLLLALGIFLPMWEMYTVI